MTDPIIEELFKERAEKIELLKQLVETKNKLIEQTELATSLQIELIELKGELNARS